jgi:hypothetical protein
MTAAVPVSRPLNWVGDPTVLVYAIRWTLANRGGSHASRLVANTVMDNAHHIPAGTRGAMARDINKWLTEGPGRDAPRSERLPWVDVLACLKETP